MKDNYHQNAPIIGEKFKKDNVNHCARKIAASYNLEGTSPNVFIGTNGTRLLPCLAISGVNPRNPPWDWSLVMPDASHL